MAERDFTTKNGGRWSLLAQLPPGPAKDNLVEIQKDMEEMERAKEVLLTLAHHEDRCERQTVTLAIDTVYAIANIIDSRVDSVVYHLNLIFGKESPVPAGGE